MKKLLLIATIVSVANLTAKAQLTAITQQVEEPTPTVPPLAAYISSIPGHDTLKLGVVQRNITFSFTMADTNDVAEIHVKAGHTEGGSEIYSGSFNYDNNASLRTGGVIHRSGTTVTVTITADVISGKRKYYEIYTKNKQGQNSSAITDTEQ